MKSYITELSQIFNLPINEISLDFCVEYIGGKILKVTGIKRVIQFLPDEIILRVLKNELIVSGQKLKIKQLNPTEIYIYGYINQIALKKQYKLEVNDVSNKN